MKPTKLYIDVLWRHHHGDDPVRLVSELGSDRSALRKLEFLETEPLMLRIAAVKLREHVLASARFPLWMKSTEILSLRDELSQRMRSRQCGSDMLGLKQWR